MHHSKREIFHSYKKPRTFFTFFQSDRFNTIAVRASYILPILKHVARLPSDLVDTLLILQDAILVLHFFHSILISCYEK